jgi:hypothetical protein
MADSTVLGLALPTSFRSIEAQVIDIRRETAGQALPYENEETPATRPDDLQRIFTKVEELSSFLTPGYDRNPVKDFAVKESGGSRDPSVPQGVARQWITRPTLVESVADGKSWRVC